MKFQNNNSITFAGKKPARMRWPAITVAAGLLTLAIPAISSAATAVNLGSASYFTILTKTGISTTGTTHVVGNMGVSPISSTAITGFSLIQKTPTYAKSPLVTGNILAANYAAPTPAHLTTEIADMQKAYSDAAGRLNPNTTNYRSGNIGGLTIRPGLYKWTSGVTIPANVTLSGGPNAIWIFQVAGTLSVSSGRKVLLAGGAQNKNIFWQVAGSTTLGTSSVLHGIVLGKTGIMLKTGATLYGKALSQTAVTLDASLVEP